MSKGTENINSGNFKEWNEIWKLGENEFSEENFLFTRGAAKNLRQFWQKCYFEDLLRIVKEKNYKSFLEQGSGRGTTSMYLSNAGYKDISMLDLAPEAFNIASQYFKYCSLPLPQFVLADVRQSGLPDESFDCIYNIGLLEHFEDPKPVLEESYRLLKPGGAMFMVIVSGYPFSKSIVPRLIFNPISIAKYIMKKIIGSNKTVQSDMVRTAYSREYYESIMTKIGCKDIKCISYNPYQKVYINEKLERFISMPFYKFHYKIKRLFSKSFALKSLPFLSFCDLLICYKK